MKRVRFRAAMPIVAELAVAGGRALNICEHLRNLWMNLAAILVRWQCWDLIRRLRRFSQMDLADRASADFRCVVGRQGHFWAGWIA
ncbi:MAG: hypothetical protein WD971_14430 [Pirellulales bacterium]